MAEHVAHEVHAAALPLRTEHLRDRVPAGAPIRAVQAWMGHASITTTQVYADYAPEPSNGAAFAAKAFSAPDQDRVVPNVVPN